MIAQAAQPSDTSTPEAKRREEGILRQYSKSMEDLLAKGTYNSGRRPSEHHIGQRSFLKNNMGAIPPNVLIPPAQDVVGPLNLLSYANTAASDPYQAYCRANDITPHPARMQPKLAEFFVEFLTDEGDLVMDPFAGSNTTGAVAERMNRDWIAVELDPDTLPHHRPGLHSPRDEQWKLTG